MIQGVAIELTLPDSRLVMQRRDDKAPSAPNLLSFFGGGLELGEDPLDGMVRELEEETSLRAADLHIGCLGSLHIPSPEYLRFTKLRVHLFHAAIQSMDFEVYEGVGAECYALPEIHRRPDISHVTQYLLPRLLAA